MKKQTIKRLFHLLIFSFIWILSGDTASAQEPEYFGKEAGKKFDWTIFYLNAHYVDSLDADRLTELAIIRIMEELDPFSNYQSREALEAQRKRDEGIKNDGLGFRYYVINDTATVTFIDTTGPAISAGLQLGDKILEVNGKSIIGQNFEHLDAQLLAPRDTIVNLLVKRRGTPVSFPLSVKSVSLFAASIDAAYMIRNNIGLIKLNRFTGKTMGEFRNALKRLQSQGLEHLILDLRNNRGGVVKAATDLADEFLEKDQRIMRSAGQGMTDKEVVATGKGSLQQGKIVILTNGVTASASEIFTSALQEWDRALVIGEMTYGKGLIQQSYLLNDSSAVRLTIGRYFTPTDRMLQRPYHFDSSKDWLFQNIAHASTHHNGFTYLLAAPDSVRWTTKTGRKILRGQGGIIPDIYQAPLIKNNPLLQKLNDLGVTYQFTTYLSDQLRQDYQRRYPTSDKFRNDPAINRELSNHLKAYLMANMDDKGFASSLLTQAIPQAVLTQIKAWMGPQIWDSGTYYAVLNEEDELIQRAIQEIQGNTFDKLGLRF